MAIYGRLPECILLMYSPIIRPGVEFWHATVHD